MTQATNQLSAVPVDTGKEPKSGSKAIPVTYDFSQAASFTTDLTAQKLQGKLTIFQSVYIDNSNNNQPITVQMSGLNQKISIPAQYQGIFPVFVSDQPVFFVSSQGSGTALVAFSNAHLPPAVWPTVPNPVSVSGAIQTNDPTLDATVTGNRVQTLMKPAAVSYTDHSGTVAAANTSQVLMAANPARIGFLVMNVDEVNLEEVGINLTGAAASIGNAGTVTLAASSGAGYTGGSFQGSGTNVITIVAATAGHKFTCVEW